MEHQKEDISIKMEDNNGDDNADDYVVDTGMESGSEAPPAQLYPWPTLDFPVPKYCDFKPDENNYWVVVFKHMPLVRNMRTFRDQFVWEIKNNLPAEFQGDASSIFWERVFPRVWDEYKEKWERYRDDSGNPNILSHTNFFVPVRSAEEGKALIAYWNKKDYYQKKLAVFLSSKHGRGKFGSW